MVMAEENKNREARMARGGGGGGREGGGKFTTGGYGTPMRVPP